MREIKFRAWNEDYKCMDDFFFVQSDGAIHEPANKTYDTPNTEIEENPNLIIMQYTGLKDKNGVEIYEGDVLSLDVDEKYNTVVCWNSESTSFSCYLADDKNKNIYCDHFYGGELSEIIGNIYQNPELIK